MLPEAVPVGEPELGRPACGCIWLAVVPMAVWQLTRLPHPDIVSIDGSQATVGDVDEGQWNKRRARWCSFVVGEIEAEAGSAHCWCRG